MRRALLALAVASAMVAGCGGDDAAEPAASPAAGVRAAGPSQAPAFTCRDWAAGGAEERRAILVDLERAFGRTNRDGETGAIVPREEAVAVIDRACDESFAANFRLWKLYERAVAFG